MYESAARVRVQTDASAVRTDDASVEMDPRTVESDVQRPVRTDVAATDVAGVTLVRVELRSSAAVDLDVRVRNELDGPVLPPRREGVPEVGWDATGFRGVVPAEGKLGVGYACPAADSDTDDPVVSIELRGPATDDGDATAFPDASVASAVRSLGRATPPADAVPTEPAVTAGRSGRRTDSPHGRSDDPDASDVPPAVATWLDAIGTRVERAEQLADASAADATATLDECGGVGAVADLPGDLAADAASLRAAAERIDALAARATAVDPGPVVSALSEAARRTDAARETGLEQSGAR